jgi:hypothetical protein
MEETQLLLRACIKKPRDRTETSPVQFTVWKLVL